MRCPAPGTLRRRLGPTGRWDIPLEVVLCPAHVAAIERGDDWAWDDDADRVLMHPDDLGGGHEWVWADDRLGVSVSMWSRYSSAPDRGLVFELNVRRPGSHDVHELHLALTREQARQLGSFLADIADPPRPSGGDGP